MIYVCLFLYFLVLLGIIALTMFPDDYGDRVVWRGRKAVPVALLWPLVTLCLPFYWLGRLGIFVARNW